MRTKRSVCRILAVFVALSYCATVPVLSVVHSHALMISVATAGGVEIGDSNVPSQKHPVGCEICVRIQSTQSQVQTPFDHGVMQPQIDLVYKEGEQKLFSTLFFHFRDRAPPQIHTAA